MSKFIITRKGLLFKTTVALAVCLSLAFTGVEANASSVPAHVGNTPINQPWNLQGLPSLNPIVAKLIPDGSYTITSNLTYNPKTGNSKISLSLHEQGIISFKASQCSLKAKAMGSETVQTGSKSSWVATFVKAFDSNTFTNFASIINFDKKEKTVTLDTWQDHGPFFPGLLDTSWLGVNNGISGEYSAYWGPCSIVFLPRIIKTVRSDGTLLFDDSKIYKIQEAIKKTYANRFVDALDYSASAKTRAYDYKQNAQVISFTPTYGTVFSKVKGTITLTSKRYSSNHKVVIKTITTLVPTPPVSFDAPISHDWFDDLRYEALHITK